MAISEPGPNSMAPALCIAALAIASSCGARTDLDPYPRDASTSGIDSHGAPPPGGGCPDAPKLRAPRPIAPLSTSRVTTQTPTLRWENPDGTSDVLVTLCADRACAETLRAPARVHGTTFVPPAALPSGVVYWHLSPYDAPCLESPTWEFTVGARSAPTAASWGTTLDVNGDGYADIAIGGASGGPNAPGTVYVYLGGPSGLAANPSTTLVDPTGGSGAVGIPTIAGGGDVNGDGFADLLVAFPADNAAPRRSVYVYFGSTTGVGDQPSVTLMDPRHDTGYCFGYALASAGDLNGDGYADVVVGTDALTLGTGAYVFLGSPDGPRPAPTVALAGSSLPGTQFGYALAGLGDLNGDGYGAFAVSGRSEAANSGAVAIYAGSERETVVQLGSRSSDFGIESAISGAGDVNGDGYADVIVGTPTATSTLDDVLVYLGGVNGLSPAPVNTLRAPIPRVTGLGVSVAVAGAGDVNGDGYADILLSTKTSAVYLYLGTSTGLAPAPATTFIGPDGPLDTFGYSIVGAGDVNGDGFDDIVVGNQGASSAYIYRGGPSGASAEPSAILKDPDGSGRLFGGSLAGAGD